MVGLPTQKVDLSVDQVPSITSGSAAHGGGSEVLDHLRSAQQRRVTLAVIMSLATFVVVALGPTVAGATQEPWTPSQAPMPTVLPNGAAPQSMQLASTSCSSASFCVAVGFVTDGNQNYFPIAETYSQGSWTPSILPMPADASTDFYDGSLFSVSCPSDGVCAAVGDYDSFDADNDSDYQNGLLESLSSGVWTPSAAALPDGPNSGLVNINSVSCSDPNDCVGVGVVFNFISDGPNTWSGVIYTLANGSWQMQVAPVPDDYDNSLTLNGVSCPDDGTCFIVGTYQDADDNSYGLILTLASGTWSAMSAPMPSDVAVKSSPGQNDPFEALNTIDCSEDDACIAGGYYVDSSYNLQPLLVQLQGGSWSAFGGPVPSDSQSDTLASIQGVYCPADGLCIATGYYWTNYLAGDESGMILTQSDGTWTASTAPLPADQTDSKPLVAAGSRRSAADDTSTAASLGGLSCAPDASCVAGGTAGADGLLEAGKFTDLPAVTGLSQRTGTTGTAVTITGSNFTAKSRVHFGTTSATTKFVDSTKLESVAPPSKATGPVDVTVSRGALTSRANFKAIFTYVLTIETSSLPSGISGDPYSADLSAAGGNPPYRWSVSSGELPTGLRLATTGRIWGKPKADGTFRFTVKVTTTKTATYPQETATKALSITIT